MPETIEPEPSMDEILASIRRIIADDGGVKAPPEEAPPAADTNASIPSLPRPKHQ